MKNLTEKLWDFWHPNCSYHRSQGHNSCDGKCQCSYFPKYIMKNGKSAYGKLYLELGDKVNKMCECKREIWWKKHTKTKTYKTCPMMSYLKDDGKYYKDAI